MNSLKWYCFSALLVFQAASLCPAQMPSGMMTEEQGQRLRIIAESEQTITVIDSRGKEVVLQKKPKRVLPVYTTYLNVWYECGGTAIGRPSSESAELDPRAVSLPQVGHVTTPNMEKVFSLKPDLVLLRYGFAGHSRIVPMLEQAKIPFLSVYYETFQDYLIIADVFSRLTGRSDIRDDSLAHVKAGVQSVIDRCKAKKQPRVLILFGAAMGVTVKLSGSLVGSMVEDLNAINVAHDAKLTSNEMQIFSMERLVERDPEVILVQTMGNPQMVKGKIRSDIESSPAWKTISAVKSGRVHYLPVNGFLYKPNSRFAETYSYLAHLLYPEEAR